MCCSLITCTHPDIYSTKLEGIIQSSWENVTHEKWRLVRDNMKDDVGLTTMNTYSHTHMYIQTYTCMFFHSHSFFHGQLERKGAAGRKMENDFSSVGPGHGKICRGFSGASVKSYDNRSVKRVRGYFIITDCTQTSVHYAHPLSLSFSFSLLDPLPRSSLSHSLSLYGMCIYSYYRIKGKGLLVAARNPGRKSTSSYSLQCLCFFSATSLRSLVGYGISP